MRKKKRKSRKRILCEHYRRTVVLQLKHSDKNLNWETPSHMYTTGTPVFNTITHQNLSILQSHEKKKKRKRSVNDNNNDDDELTQSGKDEPTERSNEEEEE